MVPLEKRAETISRELQTYDDVDKDRGANDWVLGRHVSGDFNSQRVECGITTMGRVPGGRIIELLATRRRCLASPTAYMLHSFKVVHLGVQNHRQISPGKVASAPDKEPCAAKETLTQV